MPVAPFFPQLGLHEFTARIAQESETICPDLLAALFGRERLVRLHGRVRDELLAWTASGLLPPRRYFPQSQKDVDGADRWTLLGGECSEATPMTKVAGWCSAKKRATSFSLYTERPVMRATFSGVS
jgi:hypothetical protein